MKFKYTIQCMGQGISMKSEQGRTMKVGSKLYLEPYFNQVSMYSQVPNKRVYSFN